MTNVELHLDKHVKHLNEAQLAQGRSDSDLSDVTTADVH